MKEKNGVFLSTPISGFFDENEYLKYRKTVLKLIERLREDYDVYSEIEQVVKIDDYDSPEKSVKDDFARIEANNIFVLLHPAKIQTSSLVEFGYACALRKKIVIVGNKKDLPYLVIGYERYCSEAIVVEIDSLTDADFEKICNAIESLL